MDSEISDVFARAQKRDDATRQEESSIDDAAWQEEVVVHGSKQKVRKEIPQHTIYFSLEYISGLIEESPETFLLLAPPSDLYSKGSGRGVHYNAIRTAGHMRRMRLYKSAKIILREYKRQLDLKRKLDE